MAFDNTDPADLAALKAEYENDPAPVQGYRSPVDYYAQGSVAELTDLINSDATSGATKSTADFTGEDYVNAISGDDGSKADEKLEVLGADSVTQTAIGNASTEQLAMAEVNEAQAKRQAALVNINFFAGYRERNVPFGLKNALLGLWTGLSAGNDIRQEIIALGQGPMSRAEELFGDGTVISQQDTERALAFEG